MPENLNKSNRSLPLNAIEIPEASPDAAQITALKKEGGKVTGYQLSNGEILGKADAVSRARQGKIAGVGISSRYGSEYLKSIPDSVESNNLGNLPALS
jgi:hypothetical protein